MSLETQILHPDTVRQSLLEFWGGALEIAPTRRGLSLAVPLCLPDGWQVVFDLQPMTPGTVRATDRGRTLQWLTGRGQNIDTPHFAGLLEDRCGAFQISRDGWELFRDLSVPPAGADLQLFGEALVAIAHLNCLHDPAGKSPNVARQTVEKVFHERRLEPKQRHALNGKLEKGIRVDYFIEAALPVAVEVLGRRGPITGYMEQWGFRWRDLRDATPELLPVMIYDPAVQEVDDLSRSIGEGVCELFCAYSETDRFHAVLDKAGAQ